MTIDFSRAATANSKALSLIASVTFMPRVSRNALRFSYQPPLIPMLATVFRATS